MLGFEVFLSLQALSDTSVITCHCNPLEWLMSYIALWEQKSPALDCTLQPPLTCSDITRAPVERVVDPGARFLSCFSSSLTRVIPPFAVRRGPFVVRLCASRDVPQINAGMARKRIKWMLSRGFFERGSVWIELDLKLKSWSDARRWESYVEGPEGGNGLWPCGQRVVRVETVHTACSASTWPVNRKKSTGVKLYFF